MFEIDQAPLQTCLAKNPEVVNANFSSFGVTISLAQYDQTQVVLSIFQTEHMPDRRHRLSLISIGVNVYRSMQLAVQIHGSFSAITDVRTDNNRAGSVKGFWCKISIAYKI